MSTISGVDFLWSDGKGVDASVWKSGDPDDNDWAARLQRVGSAIVLSATSKYRSGRYYICEHVPGKYSHSSSKNWLSSLCVCECVCVCVHACVRVCVCVVLVREREIPYILLEDLFLLLSSNALFHNVC